MTTVAEYVENITPTQRDEFERIRKIVRATVSNVEEVISYGIPTFKYKGRPLLYFGAFKHHMSVFPGTSAALKSKLEGYKTGKGTIQFTEDKPLPEDFLREMVLERKDMIDQA